MAFYVSCKEKGFFCDEVSPQLPDDAWEVTPALHAYLLEGHSKGKTIDFSVMPPRLIDMVPTWPTDTELGERIDAAVAMGYSIWSRFEPEYSARERAATDYRQRGYQGDVSAWLEMGGSDSGQNYEECANAVISAAEQRRGLLKDLSGMRLRKFELAKLDDELRYRCFEKVIESVEGICEEMKALDNDIARRFS
ncbi:hypothetical protein ACIQSO_00820 [Pseudomonas putida]|uniref:hypothetical protein n=1 Tax=Pseudomonas putida TaxID=303 RepID=UPI00383A3A97